MSNKTIKRKRIAVLTSQLEERYQKEFVEGFLSTAFEKDYDVCFFSSFRKEPESEQKAIGETNIFSLVNYDLFDAVVVQPDILQVAGLMMRIERDLKEKFNGTVLYIDRESKDYPYIMIDHYEPLLRLITHLIEDHGYKDIAFLSGHKWHSHSKQRLQAFMDCMKAHNLKVPDNRIFYGNYWYDSGNTFIESLIHSGEKLPEAIVCANDYMAIGAAETLVKNGIRVPEDIAVVGYDSVEEGQHCPQPITSVPLPTENFGRYAAEYLDALLTGTELPTFKNDAPIFFGSSCGCHNESIKPTFQVRDEWGTGLSLRNYFTSFNQLTEDLVLQSSFKGLIDSIQTYSYQIREFESFNICLNEVWSDDHPVTDTVMKEGYTEQMINILQCGRSGEGADRVDFDARIDTKDLFPAIHEEADHPRAFIFSPLFFDDITFGYTMISYGDEIKAYNDAYYMWLRSVMTGIECYRRNAILQLEKDAAEEITITDPLTGMFNYAGFVKHAKPMIERGVSIRNYISILAMDLSGLEHINSNFGRAEGDQAIHDLAQIIIDSSDEGAMCCRLGNDEFILAELTEEANHKLIHTVKGRIDAALEKRNADPECKYPLEIFYGDSTASISTLSQMEDLVNSAVSQKNGNKANEHKIRSNSKLTAEELQSAETVKKVLDENLFTYHFQPIVNAKDGSIFAYEALMRAQITPFVSPLDIIKYATHLERLSDVERATFFNITHILEEKKADFEGKKVFINSIPGQQIKGEEGELLGKRLKNLSGSVVVELTEQTEADDESLSTMKADFEQLGIETAVDDYGTGYSNIVNLLRYMPNYVKIDRMLLSGIQDNPQKQHFVKDIVLFAHENDFQVLAEGIETTEELQTVIELGVDLIQGYYTGRPNPEIIPHIADEIAEEIKKYATK